MRTLLTIVLLVVFAACSSSNQTSPPPEADFLFENQEVEIYKIGVGDVLAVHVWDNPELSLEVPVRPDGYISMPLIGDIAASNLNAEALSSNIRELLSDQIRNPQVTIIVSQVNSTEYVTRVRVTGAVSSPRSMSYARGMSVLDAVLEAGGLSDMASANKAKLYRTVDGKLIELDIKLDDIFLRGRLETNYSLRPGDVITVPERLF